MRYLGKKFGYYSEDPIEAQEIDAVFDMIYTEFWSKWKDPEVAKKVVIKLGGRLTEKKSKWLCGDKLTVPDFMFGSCAYANYREFGGKLESEAISIIHACPALVTYLDNFESEMKPYFSKRKTYPIDPSFTPPKP